jgi:hypothetical protein
VARPQKRKFLGFSFSAGPEVKRIIAPKALERFKHRIRDTTRRAKGVSIETTIAELAPYLRGWRSYLGFCETAEVLLYLTRWVRLKITSGSVAAMETPRRRRAARLELGVRPHLASNTAATKRSRRVRKHNGPGGWIRWNTKVCGSRCCVATAGVVSPAARWLTWRSITGNFAATPAMIRSRT